MTNEPMSREPMTREEEVTLKSVAHQLVLEWAQSRTLIGLNQQNGAWMVSRIVDVMGKFIEARDAALRAALAEAQEWDVRKLS